MSKESLSKELTGKEFYRVSSSPHVRSAESVPKIMWSVVLALLPAIIFSIYLFGLSAFLTISVSIVFAVLAEYMVQKIRKKTPTLTDGSACLTGILLAMCLPPQIPLYMTALASFFAIAVAKHSMGGLGYNIFNPAHIARAALMVSWPVAMTTWTSMKTQVDVISSSTPLNILKQQGYEKLIETFGSQKNMYIQMFLGYRNGCLGETSAFLLLLGGLFLIYKNYISWQVPFIMISTVGICTWIFGPQGFFTGDPVFHVLAGGLFIGAFFMATDMVTTPITLQGKIIFALGAGLITFLIRNYGGYPEGVCYSILLMNSLTPLIDKIIDGRKNFSGGASNVRS